MHPPTSEEAEKLATLIVGRFNRREDAHQELLAYGLGDDDADCVLDVIDMAYSRAFMHAVMGMPLSNMSSNVDDDPVFKAALMLFLKWEWHKPQAAEPQRDVSLSPHKKRRWWQFWTSSA